MSQLGDANREGQTGRDSTGGATPAREAASTTTPVGGATQGASGAPDDIEVEKVEEDNAVTGARKKKSKKKRSAFSLVSSSEESSSLSPPVKPLGHWKYKLQRQLEDFDWSKTELSAVDNERSAGIPAERPILKTRKEKKIEDF